MADKRSGFNIQPDSLRAGGSHLHDFSGDLDSHHKSTQSSLSGLKGKADKDRSGIGSVISKAAGSAGETLSDLTQQLSRVVKKSGDNLHSTAKSHEENEAATKKSFDDLHPDNKDKSLGNGGGSGKNGKDGNGGKKGKPPRDTAVPKDQRTCKSDPVDVVSGEVVLTVQDVVLSGVLALVLERTHVSSYRAGRWFGPSWASTIDERLEIDGGGVRYVAADGVILHYPPVSVGESVLPAEGPRWPLARSVDGVYRIANPLTNQTREFTGVGGMASLRALVDVQGYRVEVDRDGDGAPVELRHSGGLPVGAAGRGRAGRGSSRAERDGPDRWSA